MLQIRVKKNLVGLCVLFMLAIFILIGCDSSGSINNMVNIPGYGIKMLRTEVTQKLYKEIMGTNPSKFKGNNLPVENVSWDDAISFCNELSKKRGLTPAYTINGDEVKWNKGADGFRLPTLKEWQYAAKGGHEYKFAGSDNLDEVAWYYENSKNKTHPIGKKKANGYGLYDMSGNVWEWCWEFCICGGSWYNLYGVCEVDCEILHYRADKGNLLGFRIVQDIQ